ncbi:DUF732 domain-containing protein [Mycobacterium sp. Marseille-P9652]|uniref:DUF732 domain-containing protein n=1 Tax=Mycobacterium sp. Marseille-P9652 TaxID=2654950 RepID=UPI0012E8A3B6|nr:DUF732 domain-containing protein [Mycobacterium sp. Marseille-P9652]
MRTLVAVASFVIAIGAAAPAQADPVGAAPGPDANFLAALDQAGIPYRNGSTAVAIGKKACELMNQGNPKSDVIKSMSTSNPGFSMDSATRFTTIAVSSYCPQYAGEPLNPAPAQEPAIVPMFPWPTPGAA